MKNTKPELMLEYSFGYRTTPADLIELGELLSKTEDPHEISIEVRFGTTGPASLAPKITAIWVDQADRVFVENSEIIHLLDVARGRGKAVAGRKAKAKR